MCIGEPPEARCCPLCVQAHCCPGQLSISLSLFISLQQRDWRGKRERARDKTNNEALICTASTRHFYHDACRVSLEVNGGGGTSKRLYPDASSAIITTSTASLSLSRHQRPAPAPAIGQLLSTLSSSLFGPLVPNAMHCPVTALQLATRIDSSQTGRSLIIMRRLHKFSLCRTAWLASCARLVLVGAV